MKSLKDISWLVTEEEYRADPALSYSTLAKFEREGFNNLAHLFERVETPSLTFGSAVDSIITGGYEEFDERFIVADFPAVPDSIIPIVKSLFEFNHDIYNTLSEIPDDVVISTAEQYKYQSNWRPETRAKVIKEKGAEYYSLMYIAGDRTILSTSTYNDVQNAVDVLKNSDATKQYFQSSDNEIELLYQLKFIATFNNITYRCMADLIVVNYKEKWIQPVDLKTSGKPEWDFYKSFIDWRYDIQARLYWRIIREVMDKDEYFKDFQLRDYKFIVVNRKTLTPLVWEFPLTKIVGDLAFKKDTIKLRDPFIIGTELTYYLSTNANVPIGINKNGINDIRKWLDNE